MSRPYVELYIGDRLVEFTSPPEIHMTYTHEDLHNPTVVKNSYSKTVTIDGTPNNNKLFGTFFNMQREVAYADNKMVGAYFNPAKKVPFTLYRNGERMEHGYCKLDNVKKAGNNIQYNVTLYGGLGQFLYALSYKEDGEQMKLSDLDYGWGDNEFDFKVDKEAIKAAWCRITGIEGKWSGDTYGVYDKLNFAPCYNGIPKDFAADKVAIDVQSFKANNPRLYEQFTISKDGYKDVDGWVLGELAKEYDEWQMKDMRSYLQRPVIRFKEIINACCDKNNNGGYKVDLDTEFFNEDNPYYEDAWMTLPLLTEVESETGDITVYANNNRYYVEGGKTGEVVKVRMVVAPAMTAETSSSQIKTGKSWAVEVPGLGDLNGYPFYNFYKQNAGRCMQLVVRDKDGKVICGSGAQSFYTNIPEANDFDFYLPYSTTIKENQGTYKHTEGNIFVFERSYYDFELTVDYQEGMYFEMAQVYDTVLALGDNTYRGCMFDNNGNAVKNYAYGYGTQTAEAKLVGKSRLLNKNILLNSEHTPADYFLSYLKMFNLHIWQDENETIMVRLRKNYFTGEEYDLEDFVDRGQDITTTPLTFDAKWYNFSAEYDGNSGLYKDYKDEFGIPYGMMKVDTNFNFDNSSKNIFEGNVFKGCVTSRNKSRYYVDVYQSFSDDDVYYPPFMLDGCQTILFKGSDTTEGSYLTPKTSVEAINWWKDKYYDIMPKPNFTNNKNEPIDGANVLLFYNGRVEAKDNEGNRIRFQITDDIPQFVTLNEGEPCWIWSMDWDVSIDYMNYIPSFGRYKTNENGWVTHSWDFGTPKALYVPDYGIDDSSNLYTQYWQSYIKDRYNVNTRVAECNVLLKERVVGDWLRRFYYWDGCWWIMNKISDYNPTNDGTTKCEMVKINEPTNYR